MARRYKMEDEFGEHIGGAVREVYGSRGLTRADLEAMDVKELGVVAKKETLWKRPDYRQLFESGNFTGAHLYALKLVRDSLAKDFASAYLDAGDYAERVIKVRDWAMSVPSLGSLRSGLEENMADAPINHKLARLDVIADDARLEAAAEASDFLEPPKAKTVNRKPKFVLLALETVEVSGNDNLRHLADTKGEDIMAAYGVRAGEFGTWIDAEERKEHLNYAFDALYNFTQALGIQNKDIGLNSGGKGKNLAIAFGSRGRPGNAAHYEPAKTVINLTKESGAGSFAHELIHAIDDYVGLAVGVKGNSHGMLYSESEAYTNPAAFNKATGYRYEGVVTAFNRLIDTMKYDYVPLRDINSFRTVQALTDSCRAFLENMAYRSAPEARDAPDGKIDEIVELVRTGGDPNARWDAVQDLCVTYGEPSLYNIDTVDGFAGYFADRIADARTGMTETRPAGFDESRRKTAYALKAIDMDERFAGAGNGYWRSNCELLARAGAAYAKDKMEQLGVRDDYLCGHAEQLAPRGSERAEINACFDNLLSELVKAEIFHVRTERDNALQLEDVRREWKQAEQAGKKHGAR